MLKLIYVFSLFFNLKIKLYICNTFIKKQYKNENSLSKEF